MLIVVPFPKPKVLGPNIFSAGTMDSADGWTLGSSNISGGTLNLVPGRFGASVQHAVDNGITIPAGATVRISATRLNATTVSFNAAIGGTSTSFGTAVGSVSADIITQQSTSTVVLGSTGGSGQDFSVDNVTVQIFQ